MENIVNIFTPKRLGYLVLLILALTLPLYIRGDYYRHIFIMCCIWSICTIAMNIIVGYTGQANLGHGAFFGIGAYSLGIMMLKLSFSFWLALPLACIITTVFGFLIGLPTLRTKGSYFAIATLCFNVLVYIVINRWKGLTGGGDGLTGIPVPSSIRLPFGEIDFSALSTNYYLVLIFLFLTYIITNRIVHSLVGKSFSAVRQNEELTEAVGISAMKTKLLALTISAFFAGLAGCLYAIYLHNLSPGIANYEITFEVLLFLIIGGLGTMVGPILGAVILTFLGEILYTFAAYRLIIFGVLIVLVIIFFPQGLVGGLRMLWPPVVRFMKGRVSKRYD